MANIFSLAYFTTDRSQKNLCGLYFIYLRKRFFFKIRNKSAYMLDSNLKTWNINAALVLQHEVVKMKTPKILCMTKAVLGQIIYQNVCFPSQCFPPIGHCSVVPLLPQ